MSTRVRCLSALVSGAPDDPWSNRPPTPLGAKLARFPSQNAPSPLSFDATRRKRVLAFRTISRPTGTCNGGHFSHLKFSFNTCKFAPARRRISHRIYRRHRQRPPKEKHPKNGSRNPPHGCRGREEPRGLSATASDTRRKNTRKNGAREPASRGSPPPPQNTRIPFYTFKILLFTLVNWFVTLVNCTIYTCKF